MNITYFNLAWCGYFLAGLIYLIMAVFKTQNFIRIATIIFTISFAFHTIYIFERWLIAKRPPFVGMYESFIFFSWSIALVYLIIQRLNRDSGHFSNITACVKKNGRCPYFKAKPLAIPVNLFIVVFLGFASLLDSSIKPLMPALRSNWLIIHVVSYFIGYAGVVISFILSLGVLFQKSSTSTVALDLDNLSYRLVAFSFPFLTIGLTTGAVWAKASWGSYWSWDPKETWALITWFIYAAYLHQRLLKNWQGKKAAYLNIVGFLCVLFTFFGVNYLLKGLHSYL